MSFKNFNKVSVRIYDPIIDTVKPECIRIHDSGLKYLTIDEAKQYMEDLRMAIDFSEYHTP